MYVKMINEIMLGSEGKLILIYAGLFALYLLLDFLVPVAVIISVLKWTLIVYMSFALLRALVTVYVDLKNFLEWKEKNYTFSDLLILLLTSLRASILVLLISLILSDASGFEKLDGTLDLAIYIFLGLTLIIFPIFAYVSLPESYFDEKEKGKIRKLTNILKEKHSISIETAETKRDFIENLRAVYPSHHFEYRVSTLYDEDEVLSVLSDYCRISNGDMVVEDACFKGDEDEVEINLTLNSIAKRITYYPTRQIHVYNIHKAFTKGIENKSQSFYRSNSRDEDIDVFYLDSTIGILLKKFKILT